MSAASRRFWCVVVFFDYLVNFCMFDVSLLIFFVLFVVVFVCSEYVCMVLILFCNSVLVVCVWCLNFFIARARATFRVFNFFVFFFVF